MGTHPPKLHADTSLQPQFDTLDTSVHRAFLPQHALPTLHSSLTVLLGWTAYSQDMDLFSSTKTGHGGLCFIPLTHCCLPYYTMHISFVHRRTRTAHLPHCCTLHFTLLPRFTAFCTWARWEHTTFFLPSGGRHALGLTGGPFHKPAPKALHGWRLKRAAIAKQTCLTPATNHFPLATVRTDDTRLACWRARSSCPPLSTSRIRRIFCTRHHKTLSSLGSI